MGHSAAHSGFCLSFSLSACLHTINQSRGLVWPASQGAHRVPIRRYFTPDYAYTRQKGCGALWGWTGSRSNVTRVPTAIAHGELPRGCSKLWRARRRRVSYCALVVLIIVRQPIIVAQRDILRQADVYFSRPFGRPRVESVWSRLY